MSYLFPSSTITFEAALRDLAGGSPKARAFAAHALGDVTDPAERKQAIAALVRALDDDRPEVRAEACSSLGELRDLGALAQLAKRLGDGAAPVRQNAAIALGTIGAAESFEPIAEALKDGPADLRYQAATSLAEIDPARAFDFEVAALDDRDPQVVGAAALAIGAIAGELPTLEPQALHALAQKLDHADANTRFEVAYALADLEDARGRAVLATALQDSERAWDAVTALAKIKATDELAQAVGHKKTPDEAKALAAGRLVKLDPYHEDARKVLVESLVSRKVHVRGIAIEQLGEVGDVSWAKLPLEKLARSGKGAELLQPIAAALKAIEGRIK